MDELNKYRSAIKQVLREYANLSTSENIDKSIRYKAVFDSDSDTYLLLSIGWLGKRRIHSCLINVEIIGDKVWLQYDGTNAEIALDLENAGIPKEKIVLGFQSPEVRPFTGYAVA